MADTNRKYGMNRETLGEFEFTGKWDGEAFASIPAKYTITFNQAVAGINSLRVTAKDLGFKDGGRQDEYDFMEQFSGASIKGRIKVDEFDTDPEDKDPRRRIARLASPNVTID